MNRPTLLAVNNYHYPRGGAETVYLNQNKLFETAGWQVVPFAMQHPKNLPDPYDRYFIEEIEFGSDYSLLDKVRRLPKVIYSFEARDKLRRLLDQVSPQICHAHNIYHHISPSILSLLNERGIPVVMTLHDLKLACPAYKMLATDGICERCKGGQHRHVITNRCIKNSLALSSIVYLETKLHDWLHSYTGNVRRFVAPSRFFRDKMIEWGIAPDSLVHIPNAIPFGGYAPPRDIGKHFVYIGRLGPEKGLATLIRAALGTGCRLVIAGTGPEEARLKALAEPSDGKIEFAGFVSGDALHQLIRSARAIVLPSEWYENAPVSVLEAYREGIPVIGANIGGIPEMVHDGATGHLFPSGSTAGLAERLRAFAETPDADVRSMGDAGRALLEAEYSETRYYERLCAIYQDLGVELPAQAELMDAATCT